MSPFWCSSQKKFSFLNANKRFLQLRLAGTFFGEPHKSMLRSVLLIAACLAAVSCTELTKANYEELSAGKTAFIKFFAPWSAS